MSLPIPYGRHCIEEDDVRAVVNTLRSEHLTGGPIVEVFEKAFANYVGARYAVAVSSGTAGLHLAYLSLGLCPGMTVIVPTITFLATANAAVFSGANVVFSDVNPETGLMGVSELTEALDRAESKVDVVCVVHLNGQTADMEGIEKICSKEGIKIIEDSCHALGGEYQTTGDQWRRTGSCYHSEISVFSTHAVKNIAMGEGGLVTTNSPQIYESLCRLRNHGIVRDPRAFINTEEGLNRNGEPNPWYYEMHDLGYNYRVSAISCALGNSQLSKLNGFLEERNKLAKYYDSMLAGMGPNIRPIPRSHKCRHAWHLYVVHCEFDQLGISRAQLMKRLESKGIGTQVHYRPVHLQPYHFISSRPDLIGAQRYYEKCLSLPLFIGLTPKDINYVCKSLN